jgi:hypothetical protein
LYLFADSIRARHVLAFVHGELNALAYRPGKPMVGDDWRRTRQIDRANTLDPQA